MSTQCGRNEPPSFVQLVAEQAPSLLHLAFLLTGDQTASEAALLHSLESIDSARYSNLPDRWRSAVIFESLDLTASQLSDSVKRGKREFLKGQAQLIDLPSPEWSIVHGITGEQVVDALLRLDIFPRWVVLLRTFCGFSLHQVCLLLEVQDDMANATHQAAILDLVHSLAIVRGWMPPRD